MLKILLYVIMTAVFIVLFLFMPGNRKELLFVVCVLTPLMILIETVGPMLARGLEGKGPTASDKREGDEERIQHRGA